MLNLRGLIFILATGLIYYNKNSYRDIKERNKQDFMNFKIVLHSLLHRIFTFSHIYIIVAEDADYACGVYYDTSHLSFYSNMI